MRRVVRRLALPGIWALVSAAYRRAGPFTVAVEGKSMAPGFLPGDWLIATKARALHRGDVVVVRLPGRDIEVVKRVVALPGERIRVEDGSIAVDGRWLDEPYARGTGRGGEWSLGPGEYFVLGDNRDFSTDGRAFGSLPRESIVGVVRARYWPAPGLVRRPGTTLSRRQSSPSET